MSAIKIIKGMPISLLVGLTSSNTSVDLNDGTWTTTIDLRFQTSKGAIPFAVNATPTGNSVVIDLTSEQTTTLDHKGTGYVFVIRTSKVDGTVNISNILNVSVVNEL